MCGNTIKKPHIPDFAIENNSSLKVRNTFPLQIVGILPLALREPEPYCRV